MGEAESKAALAGVYSQGKEPRLVSVSDTGFDEAWAIGNTLFIIPAIPTGAPALLEYALRVRREATFTGNCSVCGATVGTLTFGRGNMPFSHSSIPHRNNCPALDANITPQLVEHYRDRSGQTLEQQLKSATMQTRLKMQSMPEENRIPIKNAGFGKWASEFIDARLKDSSACGHLKGDVAQTWNMSTGDRSWKCNECFAYYQELVRKGEALLSYEEEHTCDHCRLFAPPLETVMIRVDNFYIVGGMCSQCSAESQQPAKSIQRPPRGKKGKRRGKNGRKRR
ncbi:hypothetical protein [Streptomyces sp. NPDC051546]|uniref:hypothetical protein n=1 Tax=Streptomyces sp. NPDC051546 TaxID=3365655 RepID=UPI00379287F7